MRPCALSARSARQPASQAANQPRPFLPSPAPTVRTLESKAISARLPNPRYLKGLGRPAPGSGSLSPPVFGVDWQLPPAPELPARPIKARRFLCAIQIPNRLGAFFAGWNVLWREASGGSQSKGAAAAAGAREKRRANRGGRAGGQAPRGRVHWAGSKPPAAEGGGGGWPGGGGAEDR